MQFVYESQSRMVLKGGGDVTGEVFSGPDGLWGWEIRDHGFVKLLGGEADVGSALFSATLSLERYMKRRHRWGGERKELTGDVN